MSSIRSKKNVEAANKKTVIVLSVVAVVLLAVILISYLWTDRKAPVFDASGAASSFDYDGKTPIADAELLAGIKATDNKDGDVTDRIVIKSTHYNTDQSIAVTYICRDNAGNLATLDKIYDLSTTVAEETTEAETTTSGGAIIAVPTETAEDNTDASTDVTENVTAEPETVESETVAPETPAPETEAPTAAPETPVPTTAAPETVAPTTVAPTTIAPETPAPTTAEPVTEAPTTVAPETPAPTTAAPETAIPATASASTSDPAGYPTIDLIASTATLPVGGTFYWKNYIADMNDDKDNLSWLYANIWIEGLASINGEFTIDTSAPGIHELIYHVTDSDGHMSSGTHITIVVQ